MHTGKMYNAGREDAFEECFDLIAKLCKDKDGIVNFVDSDGKPREYVPLDVIRAYGFTLLALSGDKKIMRKLEKYEQSWKAMGFLKETGDRQDGTEEKV
jgi:hypothetical protein